MAYENYFHKLGFNGSEVKVYLALAELGKATASLISKRVQIPRTTAYSVLENLINKGVVSLEYKGATTFYSVNKPTSILRMIKKEKEVLKEKETTARELCNLIEPFFKSEQFSIPKIQYFEGEKNIENFLYDHLDTWRDSIAKVDNTWWGYQDHTFVEQYREWLEYSWACRPEDELIYLLSNESKVEKDLKGKVIGRDIRIIPSHIHFASSIWVVGDYIVLIMTRHKPHYAFMMQNSAFGENLRAIFSLFWQTLA